MIWTSHILSNVPLQAPPAAILEVNILKVGNEYLVTSMYIIRADNPQHLQIPVWECFTRSWRQSSRFDEDRVKKLKICDN